MNAVAVEAEEILDFYTHAVRFPDDIALIDERGTPWTARSLLGEANRIAHGLQDLGVVRGKVVAVLLPKSAMFLATVLATNQIGAYIVTLNPQLPLSDLQYILKDSETAVLLAHKTSVTPETIAELRRTTSVKCIDVDSTADGLLSAQEFASCPTSTPPARSCGTILTYTSGTTGRPKAVLRELADLPAEQSMRPLVRWFRNMFGVAPRNGGVHLAACPIHFSGPLLFALYALHLGHTIVLMPGWHPRLALGLIERHRVTTAFMVPFHFVSLLKLPAGVRAQFSSKSLECVIHGSAPCPEEIKSSMLDWWGDIVHECYGSTEVGGTVARAQDWRKYPGTVGQPYQAGNVRIYDDEGNQLPPGSPGTIYLKRAPENDFVYKGKVEETMSRRRGEFVTVGDIGYLNRDGYLFLLDRRTDMITQRGEHIYPAQIESHLAAHPLVADCAAFGVPHPEWGAEIRIAVKRADTATPAAEAEATLLEVLAVRLPAARCPRRIDFVASIPRDESGKIRRRELREAFAPPTPAGAAR